MISEWKSERREFARKDLCCAVTLNSDNGEPCAAGRTMNVGDGGAMCIVPITFLESLPATVDLSFALPRRTANTRMVEHVTAEATIVRHEPMVDEAQAGIAVRFTMPLDLQIDV